MCSTSNPTMRIMDFDINLHALEQGGFRRHQGRHFRHSPGGRPRGAASEIANQPAAYRPHEVSSEGGRGEKDIWGKRASWVDYAGDLKGEKLGIAILDNPGNPKHPTYWHSRSGWTVRREYFR